MDTFHFGKMCVFLPVRVKSDLLVLTFPGMWRTFSLQLIEPAETNTRVVPLNKFVNPLDAVYRLPTCTSVPTDGSLS